MKSQPDVKRIVVLMSGGIDSTALLFRLCRRELPNFKFIPSDTVFEIYPFFINYGQATADLESDSVFRIIGNAMVMFANDKRITFMSSLGEVGGYTETTASVGRCTLMNDNVEYKGKHPAYVPFRNLLLLSTTLSCFESVKPHYIMMGVHNIDVVNNFPDCSQLFESRMQAVVNLYYKTQEETPMILFPFLHDGTISKEELFNSIPDSIRSDCFSGYGNTLAAKLTNDKNTVNRVQSVPTFTTTKQGE